MVVLMVIQDTLFKDAMTKSDFYDTTIGTN